MIYFWGWDLHFCPARFFSIRSMTPPDSTSCADGCRLAALPFPRFEDQFLIVTICIFTLDYLQMRYSAPRGPQL